MKNLKALWRRLQPDSAQRCMARARSPKTSIRQLIALLSDSRQIEDRGDSGFEPPRVSEEAGRSLARKGAAGRTALEDVLLAPPGADDRRDAALTALFNEFERSETLPALMRAASHRDPMLRRDVAKVLPFWGDNAIPVLKTLFVDDAPAVRIGVISGLGEVAGRGVGEGIREAALELIAQAASSSDAVLRNEATTSMQRWASRRFQCTECDEWICHAVFGEHLLECKKQ